MISSIFERVSFILLINILFFLKTLSYKYTSDDIPIYHKNKDTKYTKIKKLFLQVRGDIRVDPLSDHALTMLLHIAVSVFIYIGFGANNVSFISSLLFAFNPMNNQGSVWISGRHYVLSALFSTMALSFPMIAPAAIFALMAFNTGFVISIVLPLFNPLYAIFVILFGMFHLKKFTGNVKNKVNMEMFNEDKKITPAKLILVVKTFGFYLTHSLIPIKTTFYHSFMQSMAGAGMKKAYKIDRFFYIGIISMVSFGAYWITHGLDTVGIGLLWFFVAITPFLNLFRLSQEIAERYCYLPNVGLMVALGSLLNGHPQLQIAFIVMYATKLWFYMDSYQDDYYLIENAVLNSPDAWFAWHVRALKRWDVQSYKEAIILWTMAKMISPNEFKVLFNISTMLKICNLDKEADEYIKLAGQNIPKGQESSCDKLITEWKKGILNILI